MMRATEANSAWSEIKKEEEEIMRRVDVDAEKMVAASPEIQTRRSHLVAVREDDVGRQWPRSTLLSLFTITSFFRKRCPNAVVNALFGYKRDVCCKLMHK